MEYVIFLGLIGFAVVYLYLFYVIKLRKSSYFHKKIKENAIILDIRLRKDFEQNHYPKAINLPSHQIIYKIKKIAQPNQELIIYSSSAKKAKEAHSVLKSLGYHKILNMGSLLNLPEIK